MLQLPVWAPIKFGCSKVTWSRPVAVDRSVDVMAAMPTGSACLHDMLQLRSIPASLPGIVMSMNVSCNALALKTRLAGMLCGTSDSTQLHSAGETFNNASCHAGPILAFRYYQILPEGALYTCCLALLLNLDNGSIQDLHCHSCKVCGLPWSRNTLQDGNGSTDVRVHSHLSEGAIRHAEGCQL